MTITQTISVKGPPTTRSFVAWATMPFPTGTDISTIGNEFGAPQQYRLFAKTLDFDIYKFCVLAPPSTSVVHLSELFDPGASTAPGGGHIGVAPVPPPLGSGGAQGSYTPTLDGPNSGLGNTNAYAWDYFNYWVTPGKVKLRFHYPDDNGVIQTYVLDLGTPSQSFVENGRCKVISSNHVLTPNLGGIHWEWETTTNDPVIRLTINWHAGLASEVAGVSRFEPVVQDIQVLANTGSYGYWWSSEFEDPAVQAGSSFLLKPCSDPTKFHVLPRMAQRSFRINFYPANTAAPGQDVGWGVGDWSGGGYMPAQLPVKGALVTQALDSNGAVRSLFSTMTQAVKADQQVVRSNLTALRNIDDATGHSQGQPPPNWLFPVLGQQYGGPTGSDGKYQPYPGIKALLTAERSALESHKIRQLRHHARDFTALYEADGDVIVPDRHLVGGQRAWNLSLGSGRVFQTNSADPHYTAPNQLWQDQGIGLSAYNKRRFHPNWGYPTNRRGYEVVTGDDAVPVRGAGLWFNSGNIGASGGSGYVVGELLTPGTATDGFGVYESQASIRVVAVSGGAVTAVQVVEPAVGWGSGVYSAFPQDSDSSTPFGVCGTTSNLAGTGCKLQLSYGASGAWDSWDDQHRLLAHADDIALAWLTAETLSIRNVIAGAEVCRMHVWCGPNPAFSTVASVTAGQGFEVGRGQFWSFFMIAHAAALSVGSSSAVDDDGIAQNATQRRSRYQLNELAAFVQTAAKAMMPSGVAWYGTAAPGSKVFTTPPFSSGYFDHQNFELFYGLHALSACYGVFGDAWNDEAGSPISVRGMSLKMARTVETLMLAESHGLTGGAIAGAGAGPDGKGSGYTALDVVTILSDKDRFIFPVISNTMPTLRIDSVDGGGGVTAFTVLTAGKVFEDPTTGTAPDFSDGLAVPVHNGAQVPGALTYSKITAAAVSAPGSGYSNGTINVTVPGGVPVRGDQDKAIVRITIAGGVISAVSILNDGTLHDGRYHVPPPATFNIQGGNGAGAITVTRSATGQGLRVDTLTWNAPVLDAVGTGDGGSCFKVFPLGPFPGSTRYASRADFSPRDICIRTIGTDPWNPNAAGAQAIQFSSLQPHMGIWGFFADEIGEEPPGYWRNVSLRSEFVSTYTAYQTIIRKRLLGIYGNVLYEAWWPQLAYVVKDL